MQAVNPLLYDRSVIALVLDYYFSRECSEAEGEDKLPNSRLFLVLVSRKLKTMCRVLHNPLEEITDAIYEHS